MLRPLLILACIMIAVGIGTCAINRHVIERTAAGRPIDWAGDGGRCFKCREPGVRWLRDHDYHCGHCGADYHARLNLETNEFEVW